MTADEAKLREIINYISSIDDIFDDFAMYTNLILEIQKLIPSDKFEEMIALYMGLDQAENEHHFYTESDLLQVTNNGDFALWDTVSKK